MAKVGTVKFQHLTRKFAIIRELKDIKDVLESCWNLKRPKYLMFVVDGSKDYYLPSGVLSAFINGLKNTIANDDVWVISSEGNVSKYVKEAVRSSCLHADSRISIGVTTINDLEQKDKLLEATQPVVYIRDDDKKKYLDLESYTHFLLLDVVCNYPVFEDDEVNILQTLTAAVSEMNGSQPEMNVLLVPPGNECNVKTLKKAVEASIPLVILHGYTGMATALYKCYEYIKRNENTARERSRHVCNNSTRTLKYETVKAIVGEDDNATFQRVSEDDELLLQMNIISALIKAKKTLQGKAQVAFALNRLDIVEKEIMKQSTILTEDEVKDFLFAAVKEEKVAFVELCLKLLHDKLITKRDLEELYVKDGSRMFDVFLKDGAVTMETIDDLMKKQIKVNYNLSDKDKFDCYMGLFLRSIILNEQEMAKFLWKNGEIEQRIEKALVGYAILHTMSMSNKIRDRQITSKLSKDADGVGSDDDYDGEFTNGFPPCVYDIFCFRSTFSKSFKISSQNVVYTSVKREFNILAMEELKNLYNDHKSKAILERKIEVHRHTTKDTTTIELVALTDNKEFMSLEACQSWLDSTWSGENLSQEEVSPRKIFILHSILYIVFLGLYSYHLLITLDKSLSYMDAALIIWVFSFLLEEITQVYTISLKNYISYPWNIVRVVAISLFAVGLGLKFVPSNNTMDAARIFHGMSLIIFYSRFLEIFYNFEKIGPKLEIMKQMFVDLLYFMAIMVVFMLAYAVVSYSLVFPNSMPSGHLIADVFKAAYWNIFSSMFFEDFSVKEPECSYDPSVYNKRILPRCPGEIGKYTGIIMMGLYVLVCNILLLNILIAMFSGSFERIEKTSYLYSSMQRYFLVMEYKTRLPLPAPFSALALAAYILQKGYKERRQSMIWSNGTETNQIGTNQRMANNTEEHELTTLSNAAYV